MVEYYVHNTTMQIYKDKSSLIISSGSVSLIMNPQSETESGQIAVFTQAPTKESLVKLNSVTSGGEFESQGISIYSYKSIDAINQYPDLLKIYMEDIKILYLTANVNSLTKDLIEIIGDCQILILELDESTIFSAKESIVQAIEANVVVFDSSEIPVEHFPNTVDIKKLKIKSSDLSGSEEINTLYYFISK